MEKLNREGERENRQVCLYSPYLNCVMFHVEQAMTILVMRRRLQKKHIRYYARYLHISLDFWMKEREACGCRL